MGETEPFVAIRSSATTEDLPNASFAGQHESYLNVRGAEMILAKVQEFYSSLFTDRATYYRHKQHFPHEEPVPADRAIQPALNEDQIHELAGYVKEIEKHYGCYMDLEFALDARTDRLWLVQARPETVWSNNKQIIKESTVSMNKTEKILIKGLPASPGISTGKVHVIADPKDIDKFEAGEILVTLMTSPDWIPAMKKAHDLLKAADPAHLADDRNELNTRVEQAIAFLQSLPDESNVVVVAHGSIIQYIAGMYGEPGYKYENLHNGALMKVQLTASDIEINGYNQFKL